MAILFQGKHTWELKGVHNPLCLFPILSDEVFPQLGLRDSFDGLLLLRNAKSLLVRIFFFVNVVEYLL
jgi:hypothetical protein